jgi:glucose/arabinose dehydrogenase
VGSAAAQKETALMHSLRLIGAVGLGLILAGRVSAAVLDPAFSETVHVASPALREVTGMVWAPDGSNRLFLARKGGEIRLAKNGVLLPTPVATVSPVHDYSESGLIGIALDPDFAVYPYVYLFVSVSPQEQQIIRYTISGDSGVDRTTIIAGLPTGGTNHVGGAIGFGPDGKLYWAIGDIGSAAVVNNDLSSLAAKISRANPDGSVPSDNPFVDGAGPNADHIWARGFRNPFTFTFQPTTGRLWVNVVGGLYEQIFIVGRGDHAGWNLYESSQPEGFISPVIKYRTNGVDTIAIAATAAGGAVRAGGMVTFTTTSGHRLRRGEKITVSGVADASFNGSFFVASTPTPTSFTAVQGGPDAGSGGGSAVTLEQGGCVTGGAFYDATQFPAPYRGNFFYLDYNSGRIMRATIDAASNAVTSVDHWGHGIPTALDVAVGPDGALYYVGLANDAVVRATYKASAQGLVVSPTTLWLSEGYLGFIMVHLAVAPTGPVQVTAARASGDADLNVVGGGTLTFTGANWNVPQPLMIAAARDADDVDDNATISLAADSLAAQTVTVRTRDQNNPLVLELSADTLTVAEGASARFTVVLSRRPAVAMTVTASRSGGDADIEVSSGAALTFTPDNWSSPQTLEVTAAEDSDANEDSATFTIAAASLVERVLVVTARDNDRATPPDPPADPPAADAAADHAAATDAGSMREQRRPGCGCAIGSVPRGGSAGPIIVVLLAALARRRPRCKGDIST